MPRLGEEEAGEEAAVRYNVRYFFYYSMSTFLGRVRCIHILFLCTGLFFGASLMAWFSSAQKVIPIPLGEDTIQLEQHEMNSGLRFVSPLLSCGFEQELSTAKEIMHLKDVLSSYLDERKKVGVVVDGGIYFRELYDGSWFGIGESLTFTPGSLLKVPLVISLAKKAHEDASFGQNPILYEGGAQDVAQVFPPEKTLEEGKIYTFSDLLTLTLVYSDNRATQLLTHMIGREELNEAYSDLGIEVPTDGDGYTMTVRTYASFFRILFNGTYLEEEDSDQILGLLAQSTFKEGLVAGVASGTPVAHKFGERTRTESESSQLHDCGIVYKEKNPYILCVMLRGPDINKLPPVIARISREVYEAVQ